MQLCYISILNVCEHSFLSKISVDTFGIKYRNRRLNYTVNERIRGYNSSQDSMHGTCYALNIGLMMYLKTKKLWK